MEHNATYPVSGVRKWAWLLGFAYFFYLMLAITLKYVPFSSKAAFLILKQDEVKEVPGYLSLFYIHVYSSIFALLAGFTQFSSFVLRRYPEVHRNVGRLYVYIVLFLSAPSGIFIGIFANGGLWSRIAFVMLGTMWFWFTLHGMLSILKKDVASHRKMMLRSFALAASAITLRLWKVIFVHIFEPNPMDVYRVIAWLGWIPNLLLVELYIRKKLKR